MQCMSWLFGLLVVEYGLISYPVREFQIANASSFSFEYFIYPAICIVFNLHFPKNRLFVYKFLWIILFSTCITILEVILERYTGLIEYIHWTWYWSWITLLITFLISRAYYIWFYKIGKIKY